MMLLLSTLACHICAEAYMREILHRSFKVEIAYKIHKVEYKYTLLNFATKRQAYIIIRTPSIYNY